jgi:hypothetical protein
MRGGGRLAGWASVAISCSALIGCGRIQEISPTYFREGTARAEAGQQAAFAPHRSFKMRKIYYKVRNPPDEQLVKRASTASFPALQESWPPPAPSAFYEYPPETLVGLKTLGNVADALRKTLRNSQRNESVFFTCPGGFMLVVRAEQIDASGKLTDKPVQSSTFEPDIFEHRIVVFSVGESIEQDKDKKLTFEQASGWLGRGSFSLDQHTASMPLSKRLHVMAFIYDFIGHAGSEKLRTNGLPAATHLSRGGYVFPPVREKPRSKSTTDVQGRLGEIRPQPKENQQ